MSLQKKDRLALKDIEIQQLEKRGCKIGDPLNSGSFACVYKATHNNTPAAAKVIDLEKTSADYRLKFLPRELYTMKKLKHKHLIEVLEIFAIGNRVIIFMELADGGDFLDLLHDTKALTEERARYFFMQFGDALRYMHTFGYAHRDIKCENILLNKSRTCSKLTDFGFARSCKERESGNKLMSETYCGSAAYVAPEVLQAKPYNPMIADIWSMGVVLYVLVQNRLPFNERETRKLLAAQLENNIKYVRNISDSLKSLIKFQMTPNPDNRPLMPKVLAHEWFGDLAFKTSKSSIGEATKSETISKEAVKETETKELEAQEVDAE